jgi:hypothetical protein
LIFSPVSPLRHLVHNNFLTAGLLSVVMGDFWLRCSAMSASAVLCGLLFSVVGLLCLFGFDLRVMSSQVPAFVNTNSIPDSSLNCCLLMMRHGHQPLESCQLCRVHRLWTGLSNLGANTDRPNQLTDTGIAKRLR